MKLNGGRNVSGILRGFDPFMNLVIDESIEERKDGSKVNIGMVVCIIVCLAHNIYKTLVSLEQNRLVTLRC